MDSSNVVFRNQNLNLNSLACKVFFFCEVVLIVGSWLFQV